MRTLASLQPDQDTSLKNIGFHITRFRISRFVSGYRFSDTAYSFKIRRPFRGPASKPKFFHRCLNRLSALLAQLSSVFGCSRSRDGRAESGRLDFSTVKICLFLKRYSTDPIYNPNLQSRSTIQRLNAIFLGGTNANARSFFRFGNYGTVDGLEPGQSRTRSRSLESQRQ